MSQITLIPDELTELKKLSIHAILNGNPIPDLQPIYDWLEGDGFDSIVESWANEELAIKLNILAETSFNDLVLSNHQGFEIGDITDDIRFEYAIKLINQSTDDGEVCPSVHTYQLDQINENSPILGCLMEIHGQSGPVIDWWGIFESKKFFYAALSKSNIILLSNLDKISSDELLSLWKK